MLKIQNLELKLSGDSRSSRPKSTLSTCESLTETLDTENNPHSAKDCKANQPVLQPAGSHQHSYITLPNSLSEDGGRSRVQMPEQSFGQQFCIQQDGASGTTSSGTLMSYSFKGELVHWGILVLIPQILILAVCFPPPVRIMSWDQNILQGSRWEYCKTWLGGIPVALPNASPSVSLWSQVLWCSASLCFLKFLQTPSQNCSHPTVCQEGV